MLLDGQAAEPWTDADRLGECPIVSVDTESIDVAVVEDEQTTETVTISNIVTDPVEILDWTITEAVADCADPSDLGWVSASLDAGSTDAGAGTAVDIAFDATGETAPDILTGVLCVSSNDAGDPVVAIPLSLQVQYPLTGLPAGPRPGNADGSVGVVFSLGGDRGLDFLAEGSPTVVPLDCDTLEATGGPEAAEPFRDPALSYDPATDRYRWAWAAGQDKAGTCWAFVIGLDDASTHTTVYRFRR